MSRVKQILLCVWLLTFKVTERNIESGIKYKNEKEKKKVKKSSFCLRPFSLKLYFFPLQITLK